MKSLQRGSRIKGEVRKEKVETEFEGYRDSVLDFACGWLELKPEEMKNK